MREFTTKLTAECVGTFALVFVGAGAVVVEGHTGMSHLGIPDGKVGLVGIALAHGLTLAAMIFAFGTASGAHFNPAVSLAMWLRRKIDGQDLGGYIGAQVVGALVAAGFLAVIFPDEVSLSALGTPTLGPRISGLQGVAVETVITFLFVTAILFITRKESEAGGFAGIAIGGALAALILFAGPLTGAAANPARWLGPAVVSGNIANAAIYLGGPLSGAGAAGLLFGLWADRAEEEAAEPSAAESGGEVLRGSGGGVGDRARRAEATLRQAAELVSRGSPDAAAILLAPLLPELDEHDPTTAGHLRALALVIEDEHGPIEAFAPHQDRLWATAGEAPAQATT